jgi:hypothetical protein
MLALSDQLSKVAINRRNYSRLLRAFARGIVTFASQVRSDSTEKFSVLQSYYNEIADLHDNMADAEAQTGEDIRDLVERYAVLARVTDEYNVQKDACETISNSLLEAMAAQTVASKQGNYEKVKMELENRVLRIRFEKKFNCKLLIEKVKQLIAVRQKYSVFKLRRLEHGWHAYAQAKGELAQRQKSAVLQIVDLFGEAVQVREEAVEVVQGGPPVAELPEVLE